ncbi:MAG: hemerythrin domain-containing protein [Brevundimonas sp.]|uniref:hemerythrin domain-containing protein n=1 Tax=Brevundimonas sp. TaxID=1871086 RepID=UPI00272470FD|nr:hemerythrin domain-containing protein [Brevundimonas sp.]MDO9589147.1 hemerythrin domain-containing protein [Brevundimonas sp.]
MSDAPDTALALASRPGLPRDWLYLRDAFPRDRWASTLDQTAAFWMQMHAGFRGHQAHMDRLISQWRADGDAAALHSQLIPALQSFLQHLDGHHRIESGQYFPMMRRIEPKIGAGIDLLDRDHDAIHETLEAMFRDGLAFHQAMVSRAPDAADKAGRLADRIGANARPLLRHLEDEEDIIIPLIQLRGLHDPV